MNEPQESSSKSAPARSDSGAAGPGLKARLRYPDFLCIGAQKAGTTWLHENLRFHPRIWLPPVKELQYFNDIHIPEHRAWTGKHRRLHGSRALQAYLANTPKEQWNYHFIARVAEIINSDLSDEWYGSIFALARPDQVCGEATPEYSILPPAGIQHVVRLAPAAKILLMLRDPIERNWSHIRMNAPPNASIEDLKRIAQYRDVVSRADYPKIIARWSEFIAPERRMIVFMDDITARPRVVMARICAFLGIEYDERFFTRLETRVHVGETLAEPPEIIELLKTQLRPIYDELCTQFPEMGKKWRDRHYRSI